VSTANTLNNDTVTARMSTWTAGLTYDQISEDAVREAKRYLLDSVGCALGGYQQHDVKISLEVFGETAGPGKATVIGTGAKTDPITASLLNALMVRVMDYNDIYWKQDPSHPSDIIPAAMACGERSGKNGQELIVGIVLGHEFEMRLCDAAFPGIRERGWHHATPTGVPPPAGCGQDARPGLGEDPARDRDLRARPRPRCGAVTAGKLTMMKNTVDPMATQSGVLAALLAERGYTGPEHVIRSEEHTSELQSPYVISYAVFCLKKKNTKQLQNTAPNKTRAKCIIKKANTEWTSEHD